MSSNIVWQQHRVTRKDRESLNGHKACILWLTGLSGSGKSTLANAVEKKLHERRCHTYLLDGDNLRHGLCADLDFSEADRTENIRRVAEVAKLFVDAGTLVLVTLISPFRADRDQARQRMAAGEFVEIFVKCPLAVCEERDVKGLYKKARAGEIQDLTGIGSPYEEPLKPEVVVETGENSLGDCVDQIIQYLEKQNILT